MVEQENHEDIEYRYWLYLEISQIIYPSPENNLYTKILLSNINFTKVNLN